MSGGMVELVDEWMKYSFIMMVCHWPNINNFLTCCTFLSFLFIEDSIKLNNLLIFIASKLFFKILFYFLMFLLL